MTLVLVLLLWFVVGALLATGAQTLVLKFVKRPRARKTPCIKTGVFVSLARLAFLCWLCQVLLDCPLTDRAIKVLLLADVLATALHAWHAVRRYGVYARRSGFRTGANLGSLVFGMVYFCCLLF